MNKKNQQMAAHLIKDIQDTFMDSMIATRIPYHVIKAVEKLEDIIGKENVVTALENESDRSINFFVTDDNISERVREFKTILEAGLGFSMRGTKKGIRVRIDYCYSEE